MVARKLKNPSIIDIAKTAKVAISTVSNVINDKDLVTEKTRKKVLKAIDKLGYKPNIIARSLRTKKTRTIGSIVYDISNPFVAQIVRGMEEVAKNRGYIMVLGCTFNEKSEEKRQVDVLINQFIDGLVIVSGQDNADIYSKVKKKKIPIVFIDREISATDFASVIINNIEAASSAVDYLFSLGHREIGYISYPLENQTIVRNRYNGYLKGLLKNGLVFNPNYVVIDKIFIEQELEGRDMEATYNIMKKFISEKKLPTAFIAISDIMAYGLMKALKDSGKKIPDDVSVIGFDNIIFDDYVTPTLTTIKQPKKLMGTTAMGLLLDIIEGKTVENKNIVLPSKLIERESTRPPKIDAATLKNPE